MASAVYSAGEERLDLLIRMVPISFPGSEHIVNGLSVLTAVLINDPGGCAKAGVADVVRYKLEEIRSVRQSSEDIDDVDVGIMFDFYCDVMRCYAGTGRRELTECEFKKMKTYTPKTLLRGVVDGEFGKLHDALASLGGFYLPSNWASASFVQFREYSRAEATSMQKYCYLRLFAPPFCFLVGSILGPRPTLGSILSLLAERVCKPTDELEDLYVIRKPNNDLHITSRTPAGAHLYVNDLLLFRDDEEGRSTGLLSIFDRVGASQSSVSHDTMFEQAMSCLDDIVNAASEQTSENCGTYRLASLDFDICTTTVDFPDGPNSLRLKCNGGYLPSFIRTWKPQVRSEALVIALKEYNDRVLNLHVASAGLANLRKSGKLARCSSRWRKEVAEMISISRSDADYWLDVADELADGFRTLYNSALPDWMQSDFERKALEFVDDAQLSIEKASSRPASSFCSESFMAELGNRHSRRVSASSSSSRSSAASVGETGYVCIWETFGGTKFQVRLPAECKERYKYLMTCPEYKIPGYEASMPVVQRFKLAGTDCYRKYKVNYVKTLVLKEFTN